MRWFFFVYFCDMNSNLNGVSAELKFCVECLRRGIIPSLPISQHSRYDVVVDDGNRFYKIQVKSNFKDIKENQKSFKVNLTTDSNGYSQEEVDFFAVYIHYYKGFFIIKNIGKMSTIRLNLEGKNRHYFNKFEFHSF